MAKKPVESVDLRFEMVSLDELEDLQGSLKFMTEESRQRLRTSLLKHGFTYPCFIWNDGKKKRILDGHQRVHETRALRDEGHDVPAKVPVVVVPAKSARDAKEKLMLAVSQYGTVSVSGLDEFLKSARLDAAKLDRLVQLPDLDLSSLVPVGELDVEPFEPDVDILVTTNKCPSCGYEW